MDRDFNRERTLLDAINRTVVNGVPIAEHSYMEDEAIWQSFQQFLVDAEIITYLKLGSFDAYREWDGALRAPSLKIAFTFAAVALGNLIGTLWLIIGRQKVLIFSVDKVSDRNTHSDFRIAPLYEALKDEHARYVECFHTVLGKSTFFNALTRLRPALYLEGIDALWYALRAVGISRQQPLRLESVSGTDDEKKFIAHVIRKYVALFPLIAFRTEFFEIVLKLSAVRLMIGVDDARHYHALVEACRRCTIRTVVLQHGGGHYSPYHPGWLGSPVFGGKRYLRADCLVVWSEYWVRVLKQLGSVYPQSSIVVGGAPSILEDPFAPKAVERVVVVPHETESNKGEVSEYLKALAACPDTSVYFKIRPDLTRESQCNKYERVPWGSIRVSEWLSEVPRPSVAVGAYSTFLYDMIAVEVPVLRMETSMEYGRTIVTEGLAGTLPLASVCASIEAAATTPHAILDERKKKLVSDLKLVATLRSIIRDALH